MSPFILIQEKQGVCAGSYKGTQSLGTLAGTIRKVQKQVRSFQS